MKRKNIKGIFSKPMDPQTDPVIENNNLPAMPDVKQNQPGQIKHPPKGKGYMPSSPAKISKINRIAISKGLEMAPFNEKENKKIKVQMPDQGYHDQAEKKSRKNEPGYIVFRMRVQDGQISVVGARKIEGPFLENENLIQSGITYEAFLKDRRIAVGSIPDYGEQRSFARPQSDPSHEGHHITILPGFDFNLKIAADKITFKELPGIRLTLYRFKEHVPDLSINAAPLKVRFEKEVRVVAEMNGIEVERLHDDIKKSLKQIFKSK